MQKIPLNMAKPGMVLAKPLTRDNGMILVAEGTELSQKIIDRLEQMDIQQIIVQGEPVSLDAEALGLSFEQRLERLEHLFRGHQEDGWMQEVKEHLRKYFRSKIDAQDAGHDQNSEQER